MTSLEHRRPTRLDADGKLTPAYRDCPDCIRWYEAYLRGDGWARLGMPPYSARKR
jgi:hypothetical protein